MLVRQTDAGIYRYCERILKRPWYFGHLMRRVDSLEKTLMLGGIRGRKEEKGTTEDEMAGWHHRLEGQEFG